MLKTSFKAGGAECGFKAEDSLFYKERSDHLVERAGLMSALDKERTDHLSERTDLLAALDKERSDHLAQRIDLLAALDKKRTSHKEEIAALRTFFDTQLITQKHLLHKSRIAIRKLEKRDPTITPQEICNILPTNTPRMVRADRRSPSASMSTSKNSFIDYACPRLWKRYSERGYLFTFGVTLCIICPI